MNRHGVRWFLLAVLLLWSTDIGEDVPWPPPEVPGPPPEAAKKQPPTPSAPRYSQEKFKNRDGEMIDDRAFIAAFRRQATAELLPCLKAWHAGPQSLTLSATLDKPGHLTGIGSMGEELPECATKAMAAMSFATITAPLKVKHITVQWRVDW